MFLLFPESGTVPARRNSAVDIVVRRQKDEKVFAVREAVVLIGDPWTDCVADHCRAMRLATSPSKTDEQAFSDFVTYTSGVSSGILPFPRKGGFNELAKRSDKRTLAHDATNSRGKTQHCQDDPREAGC